MLYDRGAAGCLWSSVVLTRAAARHLETSTSNRASSDGRLHQSLHPGQVPSYGRNFLAPRGMLLWSWPRRASRLLPPLPLLRLRANASGSHASVSSTSSTSYSLMKACVSRARTTGRHTPRAACRTPTASLTAVLAGKYIRSLSLPLTVPHPRGRTSGPSPWRAAGYPRADRLFGQHRTWQIWHAVRLTVGVSGSMGRLPWLPMVGSDVLDEAPTLSHRRPASPTSIMQSLR